MTRASESTTAPGRSARGGSPLTTQKRTAILEAALAEFEARGFRETSMDRIAETAGVSKRTVYNHFASKDALFDAIIDELSERVAEGTDVQYDAAAPLDAQLRLIAGQVLDMMIAPCFVTLARVALVEMLRSPELAARIYDLVRERQTGVAQWLAAATDDGRLDVDDATWVADQFLGLIRSFAFWPQTLGGQKAPDVATRERIIDSSVELILARYRRA